MYLQIKRIETEETPYGNDIVIKMIQLREDDGTFIKNVKLNDELIQVLKNSKIQL